VVTKPEISAPPL